MSHIILKHHQKGNNNGKWHLCNRPSGTCSQKVSFFPVPHQPTERDWVRFRSKGKLYSLIRKWRVGSSSSRAQAFPERPWAGLLCRISSLRSVEFLWGRCSCAAHSSRSQCWAQQFCSQPAATILSCYSAHSPQAEVLAQPFYSRNSGLKVWEQGHCIQHPMGKWN